MSSTEPGNGADRGARRVAPSALAAHAHLPLLDDDGRLRDPVLVVDLDEGGGEPAAAIAAARSSARLLVGVGRRAADPAVRPLVRELSMTLVPVGQDAADPALVGVPDPARAERAVRAAVRAHPHAATVLARLLRWSGVLDVPSALEAESLAYSTLLGGPEFHRWLRGRAARPQRPAPSGPPVVATRVARELRIRLNRPARRNAYGREVRDALVAALEIAVWDPDVRRVVLDGAGPAFCSGGDLDEFGTAPDPVTAHVVRTRAGAALPLSLLADRLEARLHGACVGAGIELPAWARRIVAAPDTRIRLPEVGMGLIPGAGGTVSLPRRIGRWRTLYLAVAGEELDAHTAVRWGLVDRIG